MKCTKCLISTIEATQKIENDEYRSEALIACANASEKMSCTECLIATIKVAAKITDKKYRKSALDSCENATEKMNSPDCIVLIANFNLTDGTFKK